MKIIRAYYVLQVTRIITDNTYCCQGSNKLSSFKHAIHPSLPWKTGLPGPGPLMPEELPGAIALGRMDSCNRPVQAVKVSWGHLGRSFWYPGHLECLHQCFWVLKVPVIPMGILWDCRLLLTCYGQRAGWGACIFHHHPEDANAAWPHSAKWAPGGDSWTGVSAWLSEALPHVYWGTKGLDRVPVKCEAQGRGLLPWSKGSLVPSLPTSRCIHGLCSHNVALVLPY